MDRKKFIRISSLISATLLASYTGKGNMYRQPPVKITRPLAITMWDFSWLERRWPGGGYEDWDKVLDEMVQRGYNAVRIDAYPHLTGTNAAKEWTLKPVWDQNDWGSPGMIKVKIQPSLNTFIAKCKNRGVKVALSTWYREDADNTRMLITSPEVMAANWLKVVDMIAAENLLDTILYIDLCNEWPAAIWTPFYKAARKEHDWSTAASFNWMKKAVDVMQSKYPGLPYTFSMDHYQESILTNNATPFLDFIEQHVWMASLNKGEFNNKLGIDWNGFSGSDYHRLVEKAEPLYKSNPDYWNAVLTNSIHQLAADAKAAGKPLITTECWALVNYKDYPMLSWDWIKKVCALGVTTAAATGQWAAMATSNFCGPQFRGMWQDVDWHQKTTDVIKNAPVDQSIRNTKIIKRI